MRDVPILLTEGDTGMKRKRCTGEQIIHILQAQKAGPSEPVLSRRHGVAAKMIYRCMCGAPAALQQTSVQGSSSIASSALSS